MYKLNKKDNMVQRISDGIFIPIDEGNKDYQEYLSWYANAINVDPSFIEEETIEQVKEKLIKQVKQTANSMLSVTDWKIIKSSELGTKVDLDTLIKRTAIRTASNEHEDIINACTSIEQLSKLSFTWPE